MIKTAKLMRSLIIIIILLTAAAAMSTLKAYAYGYPQWYYEHFTETGVPKGAEYNTGGLNPDQAMYKPEIFVSLALFDDVPENKTVTIQISVEGGNAAYVYTGLHIQYDPRLTLIKQNNDFAVKEEALENIDSFQMADGANGFYLSTKPYYIDVGNGLQPFGKGYDGIMWSMNFKLPDNCAKGDLYPVEIWYKPESELQDCFTNTNNDTDGKMMQAYVFTKGIYHGGIAIRDHEWEFDSFELKTDEQDGHKEAFAKYKCTMEGEPHYSSVEADITDTVVTQPTCKEEGKTEYKINIPNNRSLDRRGHSGSVSEPIEIVPGQGHDWGDWKVTVEPGPNKNGVRTRTCKLDPSHKETEKISASGKLLTKMTSKGSNSLVITWTKTKGAAGYEIYFAECNHKKKINVCKKIKTVKAGKTPKYVKKGLKKKTSYKAFVMSYKIVNGERVYTDTSLAAHTFTSGGNGKLTNAKKVTVKKSSYTLAVGKTATIKAKITKQKNSSKLRLACHTSKLRYISSLKSVAKVDKNGKITAKCPGRCKIYVIASNGVRKAISVTVK